MPANCFKKGVDRKAIPLVRPEGLTIPSEPTWLSVGRRAQWQSRPIPLGGRARRESLDSCEHGGMLRAKERDTKMGFLESLGLESTEEYEVELNGCEREFLINLYIENIWPENIIFNYGSTYRLSLEIAMSEVIDKLESEKTLSSNWLGEILREIIESQEMKKEAMAGLWRV